MVLYLDCDCSYKVIGFLILLNDQCYCNSAAKGPKLLLDSQETVICVFVPQVSCTLNLPPCICLCSTINHKKNPKQDCRAGSLWTGRGTQLFPASPERVIQKRNIFMGRVMQSDAGMPGKYMYCTISKES